VTYSFSGHESFPLRYGWLPKAVRAALQHEDLFARDDALVVLGVGKNMVRSIRHWGLSTGVFERSPRGVPDSLSPFGRRLLSPDSGWDPYLEDPASLWLLHWRLASSPTPASAWYLIFGRFQPGPSRLFSRMQLVDWLVDVSNSNEGSRATKNSIRRDVDVFLRTYVPGARKGNAPVEDSFDSPLSTLGLIDAADTDTYRFSLLERASLPDEIVAFAVVEYWTSRAPQQMALPFEWVAYGEGSPGAAFKVTENELAVRISKGLAAWGIAFDETAGMRQLIRRGDLPDPVAVLETYYDVKR
jgi:hypothetical protein